MKLLILGSKEYPMGTNADDPLPSGGIETYTDNLIRELVKYDMSINVITRLFCRTEKYERFDNLEIHRVKWLQGPMFRNPTFNLNSFIKAMTLESDIVLSCGPVASFFNIILRQIKGSRSVLCPSGISSVQPQYNFLLRLLLYRLERFVYSHGDVVVFLSREDLRGFRNKLGFLPKCYKIIPPGVDVSQFSIFKSSRIQREFDLGQDIIISFIGRLIETKGTRYLLDAIPLIKGENFKVLIVGSGPDQRELIERVKKLGIKDKVVFTGFRKDISEILSVTDIFVLPSISEGLPIALLESMASQCACVVTDIGLPIEDKVTGYVVPPRDSLKLANAINKLLDDPDLMNSLKRNARTYVQENHSWQAAGALYRQLFAGLIEKNGDNAP